MLKGDMNELMKQAGKIQEKLKEAQKKVEQIEVHGESGAGLVKIVINGKSEAIKINISPEVIKEEITIIEDLIASAINDAVHKLEKEKTAKLGELAGGMGLPNDMKPPL